MNKNYLNIDKLTKIFHVSDIHIRNFKRHQEYRLVFKNLIDYIKENKTNESLICLTGDIVHSKTDVTPELIFEVQNLFRSLADVCPLLIIPGNHDANLNNEHRMDSLTPIVDALNHTNIAYVKDTEEFTIADKTFMHWSVFDDHTAYPAASTISAKYKICLFHGSVQSALTDVGFKLEGGRITPSSFNGFDLVLLGDIHKFQYLNENKTIAYPGSLIQQNHGEGLEHGILVWNLESKTSEYIKIQNDTAFYTLYIENANYNTIPDSIPNKVYLRVRHTNTTQAQLKNIVSEIRKSRVVVELSIQKMNGTKEVENIDKINDRFIDVRNIQQQNNLILDYLTRKYGISVDQQEKIKEVNDEINKKLPKLEISRNVIWNPKYFEFENMFSYGKDNAIDFVNMTGTYGIFAANASGKSTLLDAISYCIFDKCSKTNRSSQVLNSASNTFYCKLNFELNGKCYVIERDGLREKNGNVRVKVNFYYLEDGKKISLNGKERNDTNASIRSVLGSYEDFALTTLSAQGANSGFIDMNQKDRKDLLSQFLDISVFESLYDSCTNDIKDLAAVIKQYQKVDHTSEIDKIDADKLQINENVISLKDQKDSLTIEKDSLNKKILEEYILIQTVNSKLLNEEETKQSLANLEIELSELIKEEAFVVLKLSNINNSSNEVKNTLDKIDLKDLEQRLKDYDTLKLKEENLNKSLGKLKIHLSHQKSKVDKLSELEYDENCSYCMNNIFVKDAIQSKGDYEDQVKEVQELENDHNKILLELESSKKVKEDQKIYDELKKKIASLENDQLKSKNELQKIQIDQQKIKQQTKSIESELESYRKEKNNIEQNKKVQVRIDELEKKYTEIESNLRLVTDKLTQALLTVNSLSNNRDKYTNDLMELVKLQSKYELYKMYSEAVHRDGVPHQLISDTIPQLQEEINTILEQLVDFRVILYPDDKNINAYIAYDNERYWPIELTSGMEKFVSSLAIRSSLINISSLPRPNFIAIDEGFGALDSNNLGSIVSYFDHLKNQFKFIMIVSHIDSMRDAVDNIIEINKIDGRSKVLHTN